jgi:2-polyprenyl-6-methoxyphenol hydroxylase-like FAD-dependent oxidoreductase
VSEPAPPTDVLIVGAGPTGLVLALALARAGIGVRIIDKTAEAGTTSRALAVQARTLEQYDQLGLAEAVVANGLRMAGANFWVAGKKLARARFGDMGKAISPFPYAVIYPQDEHERFLIGKLREVRIEVERRTELLRFTASAEGVEAVLRLPDGREESIRAAYLAGCDGAHSKTREVLKLNFPGGTYQHMFYVADVEAAGPMMDHELHVAIDKADFLAVFPLKGEGRARLIGVVKSEAVARRGELAWSDVSQGVFERLRISVARVNWFSTYQVHHRVAEHFRAGRVFLLGDAAHIHSPVGGQGMNTGIGDALNLAWKLAAVLQGRAAPKLLDSYEPERQAFAYRLVATTDRIFIFVTREGRLARFVRLAIAPRVIPVAFSFAAMRRFMFRTVSQTSVNYRKSPLSRGKAGKVLGGDRLPWMKLEPAGQQSNFAPLAACDWQVHVYGQASPDLERLCKERELALHVFAWQPDMGAAGMARDALYLVRPDGYVALAEPGGKAAALQSYLDASALRPLARSGLGFRAPPIRSRSPGHGPGS